MFPLLSLKWCNWWHVSVFSKLIIAALIQSLVTVDSRTLFQLSRTLLRSQGEIQIKDNYCWMSEIFIIRTVGLVGAQNKIRKRRRFCQSEVKAGTYNNAFRWKTVMVWIQYESSAFIIPTVTFDFWICAIVLLRRLLRIFVMVQWYWIQSSRAFSSRHHNHGYDNAVKKKKARIQVIYIYMFYCKSSIKQDQW